ncbi:hypothetical protein EVAR_20103_1 [Eumeta japonica]|uniref:Uncharacterized protein n=1 Tax=Eumeta variegata TaxID=151549 RepID=A0A4C1V3K2_EUMVA|nr:hypothetical protein EVAR_20103_1 [Eumeta japonica]
MSRRAIKEIKILVLAYEQCRAYPQITASDELYAWKILIGLKLKRVRVRTGGGGKRSPCLRISQTFRRDPSVDIAMQLAAKFNPVKMIQAYFTVPIASGNPTPPARANGMY